MTYGVYQFSKEELERLRIEDLAKLAIYYKISFKNTTTKDELINVILVQQKRADNDFYCDDSVPQMSVRIRRIRAQNREEI